MNPVPSPTAGEYIKKELVLRAIKVSDILIPGFSLPDWVEEAKRSGQIKTYPDLKDGDLQSKSHITVYFGSGAVTAGKDDWLIHGVKDGDIYPCPAEVFHATYSGAYAELNFGQAIAWLKQGKRLARSGWNGRGMWIALSPGHPALPAKNFWAGPNRDFAHEKGGEAEVLPCLTMKTVDDKIVMGWLASQTDMLANDWQVVL